MMAKYSPTVVFVVLMAVLLESRAQVPAFPGAEGFGKYTTGGRGGRVVAVTNLLDKGPGSLRDAVNQQGARTIVFRVSGTIALESELVIEHGDLTIAGQTAPGDGICLKNYKTVIAADNVIIRYVRFRPGDEVGEENDALGAIGQKNIIIDHCSMSWAIDEVASFYDNENFTLQWSIISESLYNSHHHKGPHGYGGIWGGAKASFLYNVLAHHSSRNPRFNGGRTSNTPEAELVDFRNNVIFNWGFRCAYGGERGRQNVVANYFKPGPASIRRNIFLEPEDEAGKWYLAKNIVEGFPAVSENNWLGVRSSYTSRVKVDREWSADVERTLDATMAYQLVLDGAGATLPKRDAVDERIVREIRTGQPTFAGSSYAKDRRLKEKKAAHGIIDTQTTVGGWPLLLSQPPPSDTDGDGMPDEWERANGLDPTNPDDGPRISPSGYSNLELYLNHIGQRQ
jgi:hypothetical protein